ncbi:hypothetical protein PYCCODRAFT_974922 [Trametes coccinea BRFM310]|uniref:Uncharacterized protein n=1 Tax=Trametes coccinea (strain BRFM310) TaxID=1353009 RepID=A0A1Y2IBS7_TRAC3|nr:hypothetical protein PYCCODRAFT_974922 [Trametes coccinea BRFM310]
MSAVFLLFGDRPLVYGAMTSSCTYWLCGPLIFDISATDWTTMDFGKFLLGKPSAAHTPYGYRQPKSGRPPHTSISIPPAILRLRVDRVSFPPPGVHAALTYLHVYIDRGRCCFAGGGRSPRAGACGMWARMVGHCDVVIDLFASRFGGEGVVSSCAPVGACGLAAARTVEM